MLLTRSSPQSHSRAHLSLRQGRARVVGRPRQDGVLEACRKDNAAEEPASQADARCGERLLCRAQRLRHSNKAGCMRIETSLRRVGRTRRSRSYRYRPEDLSLTASQGMKVDLAEKPLTREFLKKYPEVRWPLGGFPYNGGHLGGVASVSVSVRSYGAHTRHSQHSPPQIRGANRPSPSLWRWTRSLLRWPGSSRSGSCC